MITTTLDGAVTAAIDEVSRPTDPMGLNLDPLANYVPDLPRFASNLMESSTVGVQIQARKRLSGMQEKIDGALLDPEAWFKKHPLPEDNPLVSDFEAEKRDTLVQAYLQHANQGQPVPMGADGLDMLQARVAHERFDGRGATDKTAFHTEIVKEAQGRKDAKEFDTKLTATALHESMMPSWSGKTFPEYMSEVKDRPGFDKNRQADYAEKWAEVSTETLAKIEPVREVLDKTWLLAVNKSSIPSEDIAKIPEKDFTTFLTAIRLRAEAMPDTEKETFLAGMRKDMTRAVESFGRQGVDTITETGLYQPTDPGVALADSLYGTSNYDKSEAGRQKELANFQKQRNRTHEVRQILDSKFDVINYVEGLGWLQKAPGTTATSLTMAIPYVGQVFMAASMQGAAQEDLYLEFRNQGLSESNAGNYSSAMAPAVMIPQMILEEAGYGLWANKIPGVSKALNEVSDLIQNRALRYVIKGGVITAGESMVEVNQNITQEVVQHIGSVLDRTIPGVNLTQEFKAAWSQFPEIAGQMIFLSMFGAGGGMNAEARAKAFAESTPRQRKALGVTDADNSTIEDAKAKGPASLLAAVDAAFSNPERNNNSPEAKKAAEEEAAAARAEKAAVESAKASGMLPDIVRSADGFTVLDGETKQEVGTAPDMPGAMRIATAHSAAMDDSRAERVAYLATMLEAGDEALAMAGDPNAKNSFELGTVYTEAVAAAEGPASIDQFAKQAAIHEKINGGDGSVTYVALGRNVAETRGLVRTFTNRLFQGASVTTIVHETTHGMVRRAEEAGIINRDDKLRFVKAVNEVMRGKSLTKGRNAGQELSFLPEGITDADITDDMIHEAISHIAEAEILRTRKQAKDAKPLKISSGIISRNLISLSKLIGAKRLGKFRALIDGARGVFGLSSARALAMKKAIREGRLQEADITTFMDKLTGRDHQAEHDGMVRDEHAAILGQEAFVPTEDAPFSLVPRWPESGTSFGEGELPPIFDKIEARPFNASRLTDSSPRSALAFWDSNIVGKTITLPNGLKFTPKRGHFFRFVSGGESKGMTSAKSAEEALQKIQNGEFGADDIMGYQEDRAAQLPRIFEIMETPDMIVEELHHKGKPAFHIMRKIGSSKMVVSVGYEAISGELAPQSFGIRGISRLKKMEGRVLLPTPAFENGTHNGEANGTAPAWKTDPTKPDGSQGGDFSLAPSTMVEGLQMNAASRIKDPRVKAGMFARIADRLGELKRDKDQLGIAFGKGYKRKAIDDPRKASSIRKERNFREATLRQQYEEEAYAKHEGVLANPDLAKLKEQPVHAFLANPDSPLLGQLMSKSAAMSRGETFFDPKKQGDFDGADGVPRSNFGGSLMPDQAAQELFDHGLIKEPTPDAMWDALKREAASVVKFKEYHKAAMEDAKAARQQAKEEAKAWEVDRIKEEAANYNPRQQMLRALAMLDGILSVLPPVVRGKIGGYTQLAKLNSDEARLKFLNERIERADKEIEKWLGKEYREMLDNLIERSEAKREAGKKAKGKLGAEGHRFFDQVKEVRNMTQDEVNEKTATLDSQLSEMDDEQLADAAERYQILMTFGAFDTKTAAQMSKAVDSLREIYETNRNAWRITEEARIEGVRSLSRDALKDLGNPKASDVQRGKRKEKKLVGKLKSDVWSLLSFREVMEWTFGRDSALAARWSKSARNGFRQRTSAILAAHRRWKVATEQATGFTGRKARRVIWDMAHVDSVKATVRPEVHETVKVPIDTFFDAEQQKSLGLSAREIAELTDQFEALPEDSRKGFLTLNRVTQRHTDQIDLNESEAIYLSMMWRQDGYKPGMRLHGLGDEFQSEIETQLSDAALVMRDHLATEYAGNYEPLRALFARMFGVDLKQTENYTPGKFFSTGDESPMNVDGSGIVEGGFKQGFLADRKRHTAKPRTENAFEVYFNHVNQTEHWKALAEFSREVHGVLGRPEVKEALLSRSPQAASALAEWMKAIDGNGFNNPKDGWILDALVTSQAYLALAWKVSPIIKNGIGAALNAAYKMPAIDVLRGYSRLIAGKIEFKRVWDSDIIQNRIAGGFAPEVRAAISDSFGAKPTFRGDALLAGMEIIGTADSFGTACGAAVVYDYHYRQAIDHGLSRESADALAIDKTAEIVSATAQPTEVTDRSLKELHLRGLGKLMFLFASESRQKSSMWLIAWGHTLTGKATADDVRVLIMSHFVMAPIMHALTMMIRDTRDHDDDEWLDEKYWNLTDFSKAMVVGGPVSGLPLIRELFDGFSGESGPFGRIYNSGKSLVSLFTDDLKGDKMDWYEGKIVKILQGLTPTPAVGGSVIDQVYDFARNFTK